MTLVEWQASYTQMRQLKTDESVRQFVEATRRWRAHCKGLTD